MAPQDPKVILLRQKLAHVAGADHCAYYNTITAQRPDALQVPWSTEMSGTPKPVVFNNSTFEMLEVATPNEARERTLRRDPIACGENIMLYLDDQRSRDNSEPFTMDKATMKRTKHILGLFSKKKSTNLLNEWVAKIKSGDEQTP